MLIAYVNGIFKFIVRLCLFCFLHTARRKVLQTYSQTSVSSNTHSNFIHFIFYSLTHKESFSAVDYIRKQEHDMT